MALDEKGKPNGLFDRFCENISIPTARYLASKQNGKIRILTSVVILLMVGMTIYQVYDRVAHYLSNPINVVIDETEQKNGSTPAIVVCPSGQFRPYLNELVMFQTHFLQDMVDIVLQRDDKSAYFAENNISLTDEDINSLISKLTDLVSSVDQSNDTELTNIRAQLNAISTSLADKLPITSSLLRMEEPTPNGIISLPHFTGDFSSMLFTDYRNRNKPYSTDPCLTFSSDYVWNESIARIIKCRLAGRSNLKNPKEINEGLIGYLKHISQYPTFIGGVRAKSEDIIIDCKWLGGKCNVTDVWTPQGKCFRISPLTENWIFKDVGTPVLHNLDSTKIVHSGPYLIKLFQLPTAILIIADTAAIGSKYSVNILIDTLNNELLNQQTKIYYYSGNETEFALVSGGIDIRPGKTSDISINQIRRQIRAAKNCGSLKLKHFDTYSNEKCVWEMRTEKIAEECQCLSDHTPQYWTEMQKVTLENTYQPALNFCSFARSVFCTRKAQEVEYFCPESCEESVYEMDMSVMPIDEKKVFVRIPRDFDKKVALITDNFAFQGGFQAAPGSEQLDLLLNEIFGALMNLLSLFWRKEADPYYRVVFGQDIVNKWTESGSFGKYFLTGNRSSLPCSQFSPSLLDLPQERIDAYSSILNTTLEKYFDLHRSWTNNYTNEALSPFIDQISTDATAFQESDDAMSSIKYLVLDKLNTCLKIFQNCLRDELSRKTDFDSCFVNGATYRNRSSFSSKNPLLKRLVYEPNLASVWLPDCIGRMEPALNDARVTPAEAFQDAMLTLTNTHNQATTSMWQQPMSLLISWFKEDSSSYGHNYGIPYAFTVNSQYISVATVKSRSYPPDSLQRERLRTVLVNISRALLAIQTQLERIEHILQQTTFEDWNYRGFGYNYTSVLYHNSSNQNSLLELKNCMTGYVSIIKAHLKTSYAYRLRGGVFGLSNDGTQTQWFGDFIYLIDSILNAYQAGQGYHESSLAEVNIFFRSFRQRTIEEQEPYTIWSLLSDIGGALGLWLGGTVLTIYELIVINMSTNKDLIVSERKKLKEAWKRNQPPAEYVRKSLTTASTTASTAVIGHRY